MIKPKIRFKGYQEEWEQRKLGAVAEYRNGKAHENEIDDDGEYIVVNSKFVSTNGEIRKFSSAQNEPLYENEIAFVLSDVPNGRAIARTFLIDRSGKYTLNQRIAGITPHEDTDPYYLYIKMNRNAYFLKFDDGNKQTNLSIKDVLNYEDMYPSYTEQQKIGEYFCDLDHLITLHHRKCEEMKILKKYMLQKMFPQNGNSVPEIRFLGFTEDWEQRKFKELCDMVTVGIANSATHAYSDSGVVMFRNQNIKPNFLDDTDIIHINSEFEVKYKNKRLKKNDLLVARTGYPGTACVVPEKYENSQTFTTLIARPNENVDPYFLCQYLNSDIGIKYFESTQIGGGQKNSGAGILNEMPVTLPSTIEEEKQIADYFIQLDHLITLHQKKCDELRNIKKFMLQNMFI